MEEQRVRFTESNPLAKPSIKSIRLLSVITVFRHGARTVRTISTGGRGRTRRPAPNDADLTMKRVWARARPDTQRIVSVDRFNYTGRRTESRRCGTSDGAHFV